MSILEIKLTTHYVSDESNPTYSPALAFFNNRSIKYEYNERTTIRDVLEHICKLAPAGFHDENDSWFIEERFCLVLDDEVKDFENISANLFLMLNYIDKVDKQIVLGAKIGRLGGGIGVGDISGLVFQIRTDESTHRGRPHVHVEYGEMNASIEILTQELLAGNLPHKKLKKAKELIRLNVGFLLHEWNEYSNGFAIPLEGYYYNKNQKKMMAIPYG